MQFITLLNAFEQVWVHARAIARLFVLTLASDRVVLNRNYVFSISLFSTKNSSFMKKVFLFLKICFKVKICLKLSLSVT